MGAGNDFQLDSSHCRAICDEIGERLRMVLDREAAPLPPRLQSLMLRLAAQDLVQAQSASVDEMARQAEPAESETGSILAA